MWTGLDVHGSTGSSIPDCAMATPTTLETASNPRTGAENLAHHESFPRVGTSRLAWAAKRGKDRAEVLVTGRDQDLLEPGCSAHIQSAAEHLVAGPRASGAGRRMLER